MITCSGSRISLDELPGVSEVFDLILIQMRNAADRNAEAAADNQLQIAPDRLRAAAINITGNS